MLRDAPIRRKLMVIILLTTITALLLMRGTLLTYEFLRFQQSTTRQLATVEKIIAANSTAALAFANQNDAAETLSALKAEPYITAAALYDQDGKLFSKYPVDLPDASLPAAPQKDGIQSEHSYLVGFQPVAQGDKRLGTLYLRFDMGKLKHEWLRISISIALAVIAVAILVAYLLSRKLQQQISQPILALAETARAISDRRDYSVRAKKFGADELGLLTDAFNQMLEQVQKQNLVLSESEARVRAVINSAISAVVVIDSAGDIIDWNARAEQMFGWPRPEVFGKKLAEIIIPPRYRDAHARGMKHFLATGEGPALNQIIGLSALRRDGNEFPVELSISPMKTGGAMTFCGFITDITERKQVEEARRASEARYRILFENAPDGIVIVNAQGYYLDGNASICRMLGYTRDEFIRLHASDVVAQAEIPHIGQALDVIKTKADYRREWQFRRKDGSVFAVDTIAAAMSDGNLMGMIRDITERKQAEEALHDSEERFRTMANSIVQLAWIARADGFIVWYNQRWYEYTGTTPEQMEGWGWQSVHDPKVLPKVMDGWKSAIDAGSPFEMEFPLRGADGKFRAFLTRVQPLKDSEGRVVQWFGTNTDVEALKQVEERIQQLNAELEQRVAKRTAELEAANKELEAFSYSISHDLRAPLRAINGFAGIVLEDYGSQLPEQGRGFLERVRNGGQRMGELIDDLLTFSRLSRQPVGRRTVDVNRLVQDVLGELKSQRDGHQLELKIAELPACQADPALLKQVWVNLVSNAVKYSRDRKPAIVEIGCVHENGENVYFVRDNGVGFDMKYAHKLFGVFQRLHRADEFEGTGVGLAIVARIVHRHGGHVRAEGQLNQGATFYFTIEGENKI